MKTVTGRTIEDIAAEYERLNAAINDGTYREQHNRLFAARQALGWVLEGEVHMAPYDCIMGSPRVSANCPAEHRPPQS